MPRAYQRQTVNVNLLVGDTTKDLVAAPGVGKRIRVMGLHVELTTSAAQTIDIQDGAGTVNLLKLPASSAVGKKTDWSLPPDAPGVALTENSALRVVVGAAGNGASITVEYYVEISTWTNA